MRVVLEDDLFHPPASTAQLAALFDLCATGPHLAESEPLTAFAATGAGLLPPPKLAAWSAAQDAQMQRTVEFALSEGIRQLATQTPHWAIRVSKNPTNWGLSMPTVTLTDALQLLKRPLEVMLENAINDAHFVRSMARTGWKASLEEAESRDWLKFTSGGGIGACTALVKAMRANQFSLRRNFVIFDSDALVPRKPSRSATLLRRLCRQLRIPNHRLLRRAIENYLPPSAFNHWAHRNSQPSPVHATRQDVFTALTALSAPQRYHYNFKGGFSADRAMNHYTPAAQQFYANLDPSISATLAQGVHPAIARWFNRQHFSLKESWLVADDPSAELPSVVAELLRCL